MRVFLMGYPGDLGGARGLDRLGAQQPGHELRGGDHRPKERRVRHVGAVPQPLPPQPLAAQVERLLVTHMSGTGMG